MQTRIAWKALVTLGCLAALGHGRDRSLVHGCADPFGPEAGTVVVNPSDPLPADALSLVKVFAGESTAIREKAEQEIQSRRQILIVTLQGLQDDYTRRAKLDEAVAIRDVIRQLKAAHLKPLPNPGTMSQYTNRIGETFWFEVVGQVSSSIWGTEVYTYDSDLATAAVHMGVLKPDQRGIVKVTMVASPESHRASTLNGVTSSNWGPYSASYTIERAVSDYTPPLATKPAAPQPCPAPKP